MKGTASIARRNQLAFTAVSEAFLAKNLGGRAEPIGDAFEDSTITVPAGADNIPGLPVALEQHLKAEAKQ